MDHFLHYLAKNKYDMYHDLHVYSNGAYREEDCVRRIKRLHKYEMLLEVIAMLPLKEQIRLTEIERDRFDEAPYVTK